MSREIGRHIVRFDRYFCLRMGPLGHHFDDWQRVLAQFETAEGAIRPLNASVKTVK